MASIHASTADPPAHVPAELFWDHSFAEFARELPDPYLAAARLHDGPDIIWARDSSYGNPGWILTRHALIREAFMDPGHFSSARTHSATSIAWRLTDELNSEWPTAPDHYTLRIDGVPNLDARIRFVPPSEWHPSDFSILTALPSVNSIPAVCAAKPGLLTLRDVGLPYSPVGLWT